MPWRRQNRCRLAPRVSSRCRLASATRRFQWSTACLNSYPANRPKMMIAIMPSAMVSQIATTIARHDRDFLSTLLTLFILFDGPVNERPGLSIVPCVTEPLALFNQSTENIGHGPFFDTREFGPLAGGLCVFGNFIDPEESAQGRNDLIVGREINVLDIGSRTDLRRHKHRQVVVHALIACLPNSRRFQTCFPHDHASLLGMSNHTNPKPPVRDMMRPRNFVPYPEVRASSAPASRGRR